MTGRVLLSVADGLKVSPAGVEVTTAARKDLAFSSASASFPIVETIQVYVSASWGAPQTVYFQRTYANRPMASVFWSGATDPSTLALSSQRFFALQQFSQRFATSCVTFRAASTNYTTFWIRLYTDRITFQSVKSNSAGSDMTAFSGWLSIIVHGFYD